MGDSRSAAADHEEDVRLFCGRVEKLIKSKDPAVPLLKMFTENRHLLNVLRLNSEERRLLEEVITKQGALIRSLLNWKYPPYGWEEDLTRVVQKHS
jgi:hypothetical protein